MNFNPAERIRFLLNERSMSVAELARRSGLNPDALRRSLKKEAAIRMGTIQKICSGYGIPFWLFFADEEIVRNLAKRFTPEELDEITDILGEILKA